MRFDRTRPLGNPRSARSRLLDGGRHSRKLRHRIPRHQLCRQPGLSEVHNASGMAHTGQPPPIKSRACALTANVRETIQGRHHKPPRTDESPFTTTEECCKSTASWARGGAGARTLHRGMPIRHRIDCSPTASSRHSAQTALHTSRQPKVLHTTLATPCYCLTTHRRRLPRY